MEEPTPKGLADDLKMMTIRISIDWVCIYGILCRYKNNSIRFFLEKLEAVSYQTGNVVDLLFLVDPIGYYLLVHDAFYC